MNDLIKKGIIAKVAFQPPNPPSYKENKNIIWLECSHSKKKHNDTSKKDYEKIEIPAVFLECKSSDIVILYSHGNATDLGQSMPYLQLLNTALKVNVFSYDYQGYGISKPKGRPPSEKRVYESIRVAADYLLKRFPPEKIIIFGCSLGSGASVYLASNVDSIVKYKYRGVILQSAFMSGLRTKFTKLEKIPFDIFPNIDRVEYVECPVFLIHGKSDEIVPFEHCLMLDKKLKFPYPEQLHIAYAGHNNIIEVLSVERYVKKLYAFIKYLNKFYLSQKEDLLLGSNNTHATISASNKATTLSNSVVDDDSNNNVIIGGEKPNKVTENNPSKLVDTNNDIQANTENTIIPHALEAQLSEDFVESKLNNDQQMSSNNLDPKSVNHFDNPVTTPESVDSKLAIAELTFLNNNSNNNINTVNNNNNSQQPLKTFNLIPRKNPNDPIEDETWSSNGRRSSPCNVDTAEALTLAVGPDRDTGIVFVQNPVTPTTYNGSDFIPKFEDDPSDVESEKLSINK